MRSKTAIVFHVWLALVRVSNPAGVIIVEEAPGEFVYRTVVCMNIRVNIADFFFLSSLYLDILNVYSETLRRKSLLSRHTAVAICSNQLIHDIGKMYCS
jgi:hypothetical protein